MKDSDFDTFVLRQMPYFIAVNYQRLLEAQQPKDRVKLILHIYNLGLRVLTINQVSQYLIRDRDKVNDSYLNELLLRRFPNLTLDTWQQLFFASLRAYKENLELFFMPELHALYWDTSTFPYRPRTGIEAPFTRLTQVSLELQQGLLQLDDAGWQSLAEETFDLLRGIIQRLAFLGHYELIRVVAYDDQFYNYEIHKGLQLTKGRQPRPQDIDLTVGWFFLRKETGDMLRLYPLVVFWQEQAMDNTQTLGDVGVYDRFAQERVRFLLAILGKTVEDDKSVQGFITLLYDTIEEAKRKRREADKLTWLQVCDISADITKQRMATVRGKYRRELYLQREKAWRSFETFLSSDKRCFVLTGKSGVGKSNFLLALAEELQLTRDDICVLMYDGAQLRVTPSITVAISQDFDNRLVLAGHPVEQVWRELAKVDRIDERTVLLCVDAINEHIQADELLRQLNELVQEPWPWLKVVFSSRPETWQTIRRGIKLAEALYYREQDNSTLGIELEPFSYSERLEPFTRLELPQVYAKYQQIFQLQTAYERLPGELREILQDPLSLWLAANTYRTAAIPATLQVTELVEQYLEALVRSGRLQLEDLRFLERRLVPLLVREDKYHNAISSADLDAAGEGLYETIYSEQILSDGRRLNQSFTNLVDAEILVWQGEGRNQQIAFRYERFYEYFVGNALFARLGSKDEWVHQYHTWITSVSQAPFLWGAVKHCQIQQIRQLSGQEGTWLCFRLAQIADQRMVEVLVMALTEYGKDHSDKARYIVEHMLHEGRSWWRSWWRREERTVQCPVWKRIAINVASNLSFGDVISFALTDPSPAVRAVSIRHAFIYWRQDKPAGFTLLNNLLSQAIGFWGLPKGRIFESAVGVSLLILFADFRSVATMTQLRSIWRRGIERLLRVNPDRLNGRREQVKGWIRTALIRILIGFVVRTASEIPSYSLISAPELKRFFLPDSGLEKRRALARKLARYMDVATTNVWDLREDLLDLADERDIFIAWLAAIVLVRHGAANPATTPALLKELFERAIEVDPPGPFALFVPPCSIINEADYGAYKEQVYALRWDMVTTCNDRFQGKWSTPLLTRRWTYVVIVQGAAPRQ